MEPSHSEPSKYELISNFNTIKLRCIGCELDTLTKDDARFRKKKKDDTMVCEEYHKVIQPGDLPDVSGLLYVITCLTCNNCGQKFCMVAFDHGK
jgi:hypothetical protein